MDLGSDPMVLDAGTGETKAGEPEEASRTERLLQLAIALAIAVLGAVVVWEARDIRVPPIHSRVGPRVFPYLVGSGLIVVGLWLALEAATGRAAAPTSDDAEDVDVTLPPDWRALGLIGVGLVLYWYLIERAGFVVASALLFYLAAVGMGSRRFLRDAAIAVALAFVLYVLFTEGLNVRLPAGWLDFLGIG
jgi:putative tricarboxylic transport membrane protein